MSSGTPCICIDMLYWLYFIVRALVACPYIFFKAMVQKAHWSGTIIIVLTLKLFWWRTKPIYCGILQLNNVARIAIIFIHAFITFMNRSEASLYYNLINSLLVGLGSNCRQLGDDRNVTCVVDSHHFWSKSRLEQDVEYRSLLEECSRGCGKAIQRRRPPQPRWYTMIPINQYKS
jgi:hypothetical protein